MHTTNDNDSVVHLNTWTADNAARARLLSRREQLATAAIEHTSHNLPGADLIWQAVQQVEEDLQERFPATWARRNADWANRDAARLHAPDQPRPDDCRLCARSDSMALPRAS